MVAFNSRRNPFPGAEHLASSPQANSYPLLNSAAPLNGASSLPASDQPCNASPATIAISSQVAGLATPSRWERLIFTASIVLWLPWILLQACGVALKLSWRTCMAGPHTSREIMAKRLALRAIDLSLSKNREQIARTAQTFSQDPFSHAAGPPGCVPMVPVMMAPYAYQLVGTIIRREKLRQEIEESHL